MQARFRIYLMLAAVLAALAAWRMCQLPGATAVEPEASGPPPSAAPATEPAAPDLTPEAPTRAEFAPPAAPEAAPASAAFVRVRFRDWHSGEDLAPSAVVELTAEGAARVAEATADGEYLFAPGAPIVLAAAFERHVPVLAVVREAPAGELTPIHAYSAAYVNVEFASIDVSLLPADARLSLAFEPSTFSIPRSEHGQWESVQRRFTPWMREVGDPDLTRAPAEWFDARQAQAWREGAVRFVEQRGFRPKSAVSAMTLGAFSAEYAATGRPIRLGPFPGHFTVAWRTQLPLAQTDPAPDPNQPSGVAEDGSRYGSFVALPGESVARFAWSPSGSIRGRLPREAFSEGVMPPLVSLSGVMRGESSPVNGMHSNPRPLAVDAATGEFRAPGLPAGEHRLDAAWSEGDKVKVCAFHVVLAEGEDRDLGECAPAPGPAMRLDLACQELLGQQLLPGDVFREPDRMRALIGISDRAEKADESSFMMDLPLSFGSIVTVHGLRPGYVWAHASLQTEVKPADLREGVRFLRFDPQGDRITLPEEKEVRIAARFAVGVAAVTLRFEGPEEAWGRRYDLKIQHLGSGTLIPVPDVQLQREPRDRNPDHGVELPPGEYALLATSKAQHFAKPGEVHHYAWQRFRMEQSGGTIVVALQPGWEVICPPEVPGLEDHPGKAFFDIAAVDGIREPSGSTITGFKLPDGGFRIYGVPPGARLFHHGTRTTWTIRPDRVLTRE